MKRTPVVLVLAAVAACNEPIAHLAPVIPPLSPAVVQQAEAGDAAAQFKLAEYYRVMQQPERMRHWLEAAAHGGHPTAQISLGVFALNEDATSANRVTAYAWFLCAADRGSTDAVLLAGQLNVELTPEEVQQGLELAQTRTVSPQKL